VQVQAGRLRLCWTRLAHDIAFDCRQVRGQAVEVLQRAEDEELACYLLQLTAALRYEPSDNSRLARFLVERCVVKRKQFRCGMFANCHVLSRMRPKRTWYAGILR
jgi:Phosphoinositide 3-kinase family, accessory domain (PIK domain)